MAARKPTPITLDRKQLLGFDQIDQGHGERTLATPRAGSKRAPNWAKVGVKPGRSGARIDSKA